MNWLQKAAATLFRLDLRSPETWAAAGGPTDSGETVTDRSALALSAVWACVNLICGIVGIMPVQVYRRKDGVLEVLQDHPLYRLLHFSPNFDQTAVDFWEYTSAGLELWGNAYARKVRDGGRIVALEPIAAAGVSVRRAPSGELEYSWVQDGKPRRLGEADVLHIRGFGGDPLGGMSTLQFARNSLGLSRAVEKSASGMFRNGLRPSGALIFPELIGDERREAVYQAIQEKYFGAINSGRPLVLEGGVDWKPFALNPEDAQMLESRRFSVEEICRFFGVPPHMIGHTDKNTSFGSGIEQQTLAFLKFTMMRRTRRVEQALEKQLLTPDDRAKGVAIRFNMEGLLRGDSAGRASFYQVMSGIGAMTINEIRRLENLSGVDGGDVPRMQMQNIPITEAGDA